MDFILGKVLLINATPLSNLLWGVFIDKYLDFLLGKYSKAIEPLVSIFRPEAINVKSWGRRLFFITRFLFLKYNFCFSVHFTVF